MFPPLWGEDSYNWGAGMHKVNTAAAYIKLNMPLGLASAAKKTAWLSDQEAWSALLIDFIESVVKCLHVTGVLVACTLAHEWSQKAGRTQNQRAQCL